MKNEKQKKYFCKNNGMFLFVLDMNIKKFTYLLIIESNHLLIVRKKIVINVLLCAIAYANLSFIIYSILHII